MARVRPSTSRPDRHQLAGGAGVVDPHDFLLDDRPLVEVRGDVMRGRADQLHPAGVRLLIRLGALEAGQEGVVDVDGAAASRAAHSSAERICM